MTSHHGDPAAMHAQAASARRSAESLESLANRLQSRTEVLAYDGPAALRFRAAMAERVSSARRAAARLHELADDTERAAARAGVDGT